MVSTALFQLCAFPVLTSVTINQWLPRIHYMDGLHLLNPSLCGFSLCHSPCPPFVSTGAEEVWERKQREGPGGPGRRRGDSRLALEMRWPQLQPQIITHTESSEQMSAGVKPRALLAGTITSATNLCLNHPSRNPE